MANLRNSLAFGAVGAAGGIAGISTSVGQCAGGDCSVCFRCASVALILVAAALWKKKKGVSSHGLAQSSN